MAGRHATINEECHTRLPHRSGYRPTPGKALVCDTMWNDAIIVVCNSVTQDVCSDELLHLYHSVKIVVFKSLISHTPEQSL